PEERDPALRAISDHILPGRWEDARQPNRTEHLQTANVAVDTDEASAKIQNRGVGDETEVHALGMCAGDVPLRLVAGEPEPDPGLPPGTEVPGYLDGWLS